MEALDLYQQISRAYSESSRWRAVRQLIRRVPDIMFFGATFGLAVTILCASCLTIVFFLLNNKSEQDVVFISLAAVLGVGSLIYFALIAKNEVKEGSYNDLLTRKYYQKERYLLFKTQLNGIKSIILENLEAVQDLVHAKQEYQQGLSVFPVFLMGGVSSFIVSLLFAIGALGSNQPVALALICYLFLITVIYTCSVHDPFWFKSTKNKELALFLQVYKLEMLIEDKSKE